MRSPLSIRDLPVELGVKILEFLRGDRRTLRSCCLTSKLWFEHAQPILYKSIHIDSGNVALFCNTIHERPMLASHIRRLTLDGLSDTAEPPSKLLPTYIEVLHVVRMELPNPWVLATLSVSKSSIQQLIFGECYIVQPKQCLVALPDSLPNLMKFEVDCSWLRSKEDLYAHPHHFLTPDIEHFLLTADTTVPLDADSKSSVSSTRPFPCGHLSVLKVMLDGVNLNMFEEYLQDMGPGLHQLDISFGMMATIKMARGSLFPPNMETCINLRALNIDFNLSPPSTNFADTHLSYIPVLLESLPSQCEQLQQLQFTIRVSHRAKPVDLEVLDWERVGQILSKGRFASLRLVSILMVGGNDDLRGHIVPLLREKLHVLILDKRKVLRLFLPHSQS